jgi:glycosyltransferase involved in cell wall biosynthesis
MRPRVECRVPAYDRPQLLERALGSLQAQTFGDWVAIVFDDSRSQSGRVVVDALGDSRISYQHNLERLGATGNLNQAFSPQALAGGEFAFILEDDNAVTPDFIETALRQIRGSGVDVVSMNQRCVLVDGKGGFVVQPNALRLENADATWSRERLILNSFLKPSLPNGGYFWRCNAADLRVDPGIREPMLQESARQLRVCASIFLAREACSLWSALPSDFVRRSGINAQAFRITRDLLAGELVRRFSSVRLREWAESCLDECHFKLLEDRLASIGLLYLSCAPFVANAPLKAIKTLFRYIAYGSRIDGETRAALRRLVDSL